MVNVQPCQMYIKAQTNELIVLSFLPFLNITTLMTTLSDNILVRTIGVSAAIIGVCALKYPDRAIFDEKREDIASNGGWPIVGALPAIIYNAERMHEFLLNGFTQLNTLTTYVINGADHFPSFLLIDRIERLPF